MVIHECNKENEITEIYTILKRLDKVMTGNGQPGMVQEFQQFKGGLKALWVLGGISIALLGAAVGVLAYIK